MNSPELYSVNAQGGRDSTSYLLNKYRGLFKRKKDRSILEIGTGDGQTTLKAILPFLSNDYKELILSDKSEVMLKPARKIKEFADLQFVILDIEDKNIPEDFKNRFDCIFSVLTFHWIADTRQALQNLYDMLKPDGAIFCIFFSQTPNDYASKMLADHPKWSRYDKNPWLSPYYQNPKIIEIFKDHLDGCGFQNYFLEPNDYVYEFLNEEQFKGLLVSVNANAEKIPKELRMKYQEDYFEFFKNDDLWSFQKSEDGRDIIKLRMKLVVLYAEKPKTQ